MAILHGSWQIREQGGELFVWGETWRRLDSVTSGEGTIVSSPDRLCRHPLGMSAPQVIALLQDKLGLAPQPTWQAKQQTTILPTSLLKTGERLPQHSAAQLVPVETPLEDRPLYPYPWQVEGIRLSPGDALDLLQALPLGTIDSADAFVGGDLRYWSHVARWTLDLLVRCKFLPGLDRSSEGSMVALWQPLLDSATDRDRLTRFAKQMPPACRSFVETDKMLECLASEGEIADIASLLPQLALPAPRELLRDFLTRTIDERVRSIVGTALLPKVPATTSKWLQALTSESATLKPTADLEALETAIETWQSPVRSHLGGQAQFRTAFVFQPPTPNNPEWMLKFCLQDADNPEFLVDAKTIWNHPVDRLVYLGRAIEHPQETLLGGLGLASRLYQAIEPSLQTQRPQQCPLDPIQAYQFLKGAVWRFQDSGLGIILPPSLANYDSASGRFGLSIRSESSASGSKKGGIGLQSLLNFKWELTLGGSRISQAQFRQLITQGSPLVEVDGVWVELRPADVRAAEAFFSSRQAQVSLSLEDALRLSAGETQTIDKLPVVNFEATGALKELMETLTGNKSVEPIEAPANFNGQLRPYQARGVGWLAFLERWGLGACLADDMGLGKTIELIAFLLHLQEEEQLLAPVLLVCPTSVLGNWEREVKKFGSTLKTIVHHGDKRAKGKPLVKALGDRHLVITSYSLVYRDLKDLKQIKWQGVVLDEAQNIKNPIAKQSQAVRDLDASFRIALTGTPVENRLSELWSILDFLNPGYLGSQTFFKRRFAMPIEKYGDTASLQTLRSLVQPFILRRLKTDRDIIQDLPEKQEMTVFCPLAAQQALRYQQIVDDSLSTIDSAEGIQRRGMILGLLVKLKQLCNHPDLLTFKDSKEKLKISNMEQFAQHSGKLQRLEEMLEELLAEGDRALIFTQFAEWGKQLQPYLEKKLDREVLFLYGGTRKEKREEMVDRFQHDPQGPPIMILSIKAGGTGLNLTRANHVFHFDRWWNPAVENQATDRVFRIGQTRNVQVHKFVCTGTLEEKIHDLIESKKALAEQVVGAGEDWLTELDTGQLRNLLLLDRNAIIEEE
jgi:SNF2 family DNA or RNA helicase